MGLGWVGLAVWFWLTEKQGWLFGTSLFKDLYKIVVNFYKELLISLSVESQLVQPYKANIDKPREERRCENG